METINAMSSRHHVVRLIRLILGARLTRAVGGTGGSTPASGSLASSRWRDPGTKSRAAASTMKGEGGARGLSRRGSR